jgi:hypothetical protein
MSVDLTSALKRKLRGGFEMPTAARFVLFVLCDSAWDDGKAHLKQADISALTGLSIETVRRALLLLETELHLIEREEQFDVRGKRLQDVYYILLEDPSIRGGTPETGPLNTRGVPPQYEGGNIHVTSTRKTPPSTLVPSGQESPGRGPSADLFGHEPIPKEPKSRKPELKPGEIDWEDVIYNGDAPRMAQLAGCSASQAKSMLGRIAKNNGRNMAKLHGAVEETLKAGPSGDPFAYVTAIMSRQDAPLRRRLPI